VRPLARGGRHSAKARGALASVATLAALAALLAGQWSFAGAVLAASQASVAARTSSDWLHVLDVIASLKADPPPVPVVYLLGGSAARECTVSDTSWAAQVLQRGGPTVLTYNMGSIHQTFRQDQTLVPMLPAIPSLTFIGLNFGRFTSTAGPPRSERYTQHHYSDQHILSNPAKKALVTAWLKKRYPIFQARFKYCLSLLDQLVATCQKDGLHPVLLELPLNLQIVGHAFDAPRARVRTACTALAKKYGIPYIDFVKKAGMVSSDFYDLVHLVQPGRIKYQRRLCGQVAELLRQYGLEGSSL
jgi:hypothetical protein